MNWPVCIRRVAGVSLMPAIKPGQIIIFVRFGRVRAGRLVLARAEDREVIKFVTGQKGNLYRLGGVLDGSASYLVDRAAILAIAVGRHRP